MYPDGTNGIDNSFGKLIFPLLKGIDDNLALEVNETISTGQGTLLLQFLKLGSGASANPIAVSVFHGGDLGGPPNFDGTDQWPVLDDELVDGTTIESGSKLTFPNGYITSNTWVSGPFPFSNPFVLSLVAHGDTLNLEIRNPIITLDLDPSRAFGRRGIIAGVVSTAAFESATRDFFVEAAGAACNDATTNAVLGQVAQASDILQDGTQNPGQVCDGISIGVGFDAQVVLLGAVAQTPPPAMPCP